MQIAEICGYGSKFLVSTKHWVFIASVWNLWLSICCWITEISAIAGIPKDAENTNSVRRFIQKVLILVLAYSTWWRKQNSITTAWTKVFHTTQKIAVLNIKYIRLGNTCNLQQQDCTWQFKLRWLDVAQGQLVEEATAFAQVHLRNTPNFAAFVFI